MFVYFCNVFYFILYNQHCAKKTKKTTKKKIPLILFPVW